MTGQHPKWNCLCECGNKAVVTSTKLVSGSTKSCGCLRHTSQNFRKSNEKSLYPYEYITWKGMRQRCSNPNNPKFSNYGGRGIFVDSRWDSFKNFIEDMKACPSSQYSLGRINNDKGYSRENCRWETSEQQMNNTTRNIFVSFAGKRHTVSQWERIMGTANGTIKSRLYRGWSIKDAMTLNGTTAANQV